MSKIGLRRETTAWRVVIDVELSYYAQETPTRMEREARDILEAINQDTRLQHRRARIEREFVWVCEYCGHEFDKSNVDVDDACCDSMLTLLEVVA